MLLDAPLESHKVFLNITLNGGIISDYVQERNMIIINVSLFLVRARSRAPTAIVTKAQNNNKK